MDNVKIEIVDGIGGNSLYINDIRVAGPKPYGGGRLITSFVVNEQAIIDALPVLSGLRDKAEKWDRVQEIARYNNKEDCSGCPIEGSATKCLLACIDAHAMVTALNQPDEVSQ